MGKLIDLSGLSEFKTKFQAWVNTQLSGKKNTQTAVADPSASGTSLSFISGITQNAQGVITPTKKNIAADTTPTSGSTNLITSGGVDAALSILGKAMCVLVEGNKSETVAAAGEYVIVRNSSISGRPDGLYTAAKAIPANTVIDSTYLTAVPGGGLNALMSKYDTMQTATVTWDSAYTPTRSDLAIVYKKGQTCQMIFWNVSWANEITTDTAVGTIPAGFRPPEKTYFFGYNRLNQLHRGWIGTDGVIRISLFSGELMYVSCTYLATY